MFTSLTTGRALPLVVVSVLAGAAVLILLMLDMITVIRPLAVTAVVAAAAGSAIAQYPYLLPPRLADDRGPSRLDRSGRCPAPRNRHIPGLDNSGG